MPKLVTFIEKEFLLTQVQKTQNRVIIFGSGKSMDAKLKSFDKDSLVLGGNEEQLSAFASKEKISVYMSYQSQRVTFIGIVKKRDKDELVMGLPENLIKAPQRKAIRVVAPKDLKLEFYLQSERIQLDSPESREYSELKMPALSAGFDVSSISSLLSSFKSKAAGMFSRSGIIMFNKGRSPVTIEERMIAEIGRTLLVTSCNSPLPSEDPYPEGRIITQDMADAFEGPSIFLEGSSLEKSKTEKAAKGIISELYCPILYYQFVVGYIYVMNDRKKKVCLDFRTVDFVWEFSRILAYTLKTNNYFKQSDTAAPDPYKPQIVDLSAGGCLLMMPKASFKIKLRVGYILYFTISSANESIAVKGKVARNYSDKLNEYYGVSFISPDEATLSSLKLFLYADDTERFSGDEATLEF